MIVRQPCCAAVGLIQAASVRPVVGLSVAEFGTLTMLPLPLNCRAPPYLPAVHVAPVIVPALLLPDESAAVVPVPASNVYPAMRPVGWAGALVVVAVAVAE